MVGFICHCIWCFAVLRLDSRRFRESFQIGGKTRLAFTIEMTNNLAFIQLKAAEKTGKHVTLMVGLMKKRENLCLYKYILV